MKIAGEDYAARPTSTLVIFTKVHNPRLIIFASGLPSPVNEVKIVLEDICLPPGAVGEVWLLVSRTSFPARRLTIITDADLM